MMTSAPFNRLFNPQNKACGTAVSISILSGRLPEDRAYGAAAGGFSSRVRRPDCDRSDVFSRSRLLILGDYDALLGEILAPRETSSRFLSIFLLYQRTSACPCMTFAFSLRRRYRLNERTNGDYTLNFLPDKVPPRSTSCLVLLRTCTAI
jgi:hypothetical protein